MDDYMRKLSFCTLFFISLFMLIGCDKDTDTNPNPNPNPPVITSCKECEYYPVCDGSYFTFLDSISPAVPVFYTDTLKVQTDTTINGLVYKKVKRISSRYPSTEYLNCKNGIYSIGGKYGFGLKPVVILKSNEPVGTTWTEYPSTGVTVTLSILAKGLSLQINNTTYADIIKVKFIIEGSGSIYTAYYYFAKGIGIIKFEYGQWNFDTSWYHRNYLQSYFIP